MKAGKKRTGGTLQHQQGIRGVTAHADTAIHTNTHRQPERRVREGDGEEKRREEKRGYVTVVRCVSSYYPHKKLNREGRHKEKGGSEKRKRSGA